MNKKYLILSLCLLLVPACIKNRSRPVVMQPACVAQDVPFVEETQGAPSAEDVGALTLEEDETNPFTTSATAKAQGEEVSLINPEPTEGDLYSDSAQHGLKTVYYDFNQHDTSKLHPDQRPALEHNVAVAQKLVNKGYDITLEGHACNSAGDKTYNMMLSEKRADGIKEFFVEHGIDEGRIRTVGWGYERPVIQYGTREQQAPNRRVEIYAYPHSNNAPKA